MFEQSIWLWIRIQRNLKEISLHSDTEISNLLAMLRRMQMQIIQTDTSLTISQSTEAIHLDLQYCFYFWQTLWLIEIDNYVTWLSHSTPLTRITEFF